VPYNDRQGKALHVLSLHQLDNRCVDRRGIGDRLLARFRTAASQQHEQHEREAGQLNK